MKESRHILNVVIENNEELLNILKWFDHMKYEHTHLWRSLFVKPLLSRKYFPLVLFVDEKHTVSCFESSGRTNAIDLTRINHPGHILRWFDEFIEEHDLQYFFDGYKLGLI